MIELASFLSDIEVRRIQAFDRFLREKGADERLFSFQPEGRSPGDKDFEVIYGKAEKENNYLDSHIYFKINNIPVSMMLNVRDSGRLICIAFILGWRQTLLAKDLGAEPVAIMHSLGLSVTKFRRDKVAPWAEGYFVSPENSGWVLYYVDTYGQLSYIAMSNNFAAIALLLKSIEEREKIDLSSQLAHYSNA